MADMSEKLFEQHAYGIAAIKKMGNISENFRLYECGWLGGPNPEKWHSMQCTGAEFRAAKSGPNKGKLSIMVPGSKRTIYVSREEIDAERDVEAPVKKPKAAHA